jgi:hypothetical protein
MKRNIARPIKIRPSLPHPALPGADWADCYQLRVNDRNLTALDAARSVLGHFPPWVRMLMAIRNAIVAPFGVKSSGVHSAEEMDMIGIFPIVSQFERQVVLGFDDRHLDFRAVIDVSDDDGQTLVSATTLVRRKILFGKIYLAVITPFHNLIVATMLAKLNGGPAAFNRPPSP